MNRLISTRTHGVIDYTWAAAAEALPEGISGAPRTSSLLTGAGVAALVSSLLTNYEAGLVRVMPMKGHLAADFALCAVLLVSPLFLPANERRFAFIPVVFGIVGVVAGLMTQTSSTTKTSAKPQLVPGE